MHVSPCCGASSVALLGLWFHRIVEAYQPIPTHAGRASSELTVSPNSRGIQLILRASALFGRASGSSVWPLLGARFGRKMLVPLGYLKLLVHFWTLTRSGSASGSTFWERFWESFWELVLASFGSSFWQENACTIGEFEIISVFLDPHDLRPRAQRFESAFESAFGSASEGAQRFESTSPTI